MKQWRKPRVWTYSEWEVAGLVMEHYKKWRWFYGFVEKTLAAKMMEGLK